jgi:hypothetical protein
VDADNDRYGFALLGGLRVARPGLFGTCSNDDLRWARGMYLSRRFPSALSPDCAGAVEFAASAGVMLPFLDICNHRRDAESFPENPDGAGAGGEQPAASCGADAHLTWWREAAGVAFKARAEGPPLPAGAALCISYGHKGNEELLVRAAVHHPGKRPRLSCEWCGSRASEGPLRQTRNSQG